MASGFDLVLPFDRDTLDFVLGVEVGILWQRLHDEEMPVIATMHAANAEMALRMAEAHGQPVRSEEIGGDWLTVTFG